MLESFKRIEIHFKGSYACSSRLNRLQNKEKGLKLGYFADNYLFHYLFILFQDTINKRGDVN